MSGNHVIFDRCSDHWCGGGHWGHTAVSKCSFSFSAFVDFLGADLTALSTPHAFRTASRNEVAVGTYVRFSTSLAFVSFGPAEMIDRKKELFSVTRKQICTDARARTHTHTSPKNLNTRATERKMDRKHKRKGHSNWERKLQMGTLLPPNLENHKTALTWRFVEIRSWKILQRHASTQRHHSHLSSLFLLDREGMEWQDLSL